MLYASYSDNEETVIRQGITAIRDYFRHADEQQKKNLLFCLDRFLETLALEKTGSKDTDDAYRRDIDRFLVYLEDNGINSFEKVGRDTISEYITDLRSGDISGTPLSNASFSRSLSALKSFWRYLNIHEGVKNNPVQIFKGAKVKRHLPDYLTFEQMETMLESFDLSKPADIRDRCIIETMYACGLRVSECAGIRIADIRLKEGYLSVLGKESKERLIPFYRRCAQLIDLYMRKARPLFMAKAEDEHGILFVNQKGKPITPRAIQMIVDKAAEKAGFTNIYEVNNMAEAVKKSSELAEPGDTVLLSPLL